MKMLNFSIFLTVIFSSLLTANAGDECILDLSSTNVLVLDSKNYQILLPRSDNTIVFSYEDVFMISCAEGFISPFLADGGEMVDCRGGTEFLIRRSKTLHLFTDIKCVQKLPAIAKISTSNCIHGGTLINIGYPLISNRFATVYTVCFDDENLVPLNATFRAPFYYWGAFSNETQEHYFVDDAHLYTDVDLDALYDQQEATFNRSGLYGYLTDEIYLIKGQLLPSYLFTLPLSVDSSFNYANSVPQWSIFRNVFAEFVNDFLTMNKMMPDAYEAGTSGVLSLLDPQEFFVEVYLDDQENKVPVPMWLWFAVEDSFTIYGYNNPYGEVSDVEIEFKRICMLSYSFGKFKDMIIGVCGGDPHVHV